jgi:hypothetical protein
MTMKAQRKTARIASLALLAVAMAGTAPAQVKWKGTVAKEGDVAVVKNPKEPLYQTPILELKEELSLGGPEAQGDYAFSQIGDFAVNDAGSFFVLDGRSAHVKVFDASGKYVRTIGRMGQGPGELEGPINLSINGPAGELAIAQQYRGMSFFKLDGTYLREVSYRGLSTVRGLVDSRGNIILTEFAMGDQDARYVTKTLGAEATAQATLADSPAPFDPFSKRTRKTLVFLPACHFQIDKTDNVVYGFPRTYEIMFFGPGGAKPFKKITRDYDLLAVTAEEKKELEKTIPVGAPIILVFPKYHAAYDHFFLSDLGHVFVRTWERTKDGKRVHDIFDAEGRLIGRIPLKPTGAGILKDKYYALEEDADGDRSVKRYAVTWKVR